MQGSTHVVFGSCNQTGCSLQSNTDLFFRSDPESVPSSAKGLLQTVKMLLEDVFLHALKNLIQLLQPKSNYTARTSGSVLYLDLQCLSFLDASFSSRLSRQSGKTPSEFRNPLVLVANPGAPLVFAGLTALTFRKAGFITNSSR